MKQCDDPNCYTITNNTLYELNLEQVLLFRTLIAHCDRHIRNDCALPNMANDLEVIARDMREWCFKAIQAKAS